MGDTPAMEEKRRIVEERLPQYVGKFERFKKFVRQTVWTYFHPFSPPAWDKVEPPPPLPDPNMFSGSIILKGRALGSVFAGNDAYNLRWVGLEIPDNVPDCAILTKEGTFEWVQDRVHPQAHGESRMMKDRAANSP